MKEFFGFGGYARTPYDILYNWVGGSPILYPLLVVALFAAYIALFYYVAILFKKKSRLYRKASL